MPPRCVGVCRLGAIAAEAPSGPLQQAQGKAGLGRWEIAALPPRKVRYTPTLKGGCFLPSQQQRRSPQYRLTLRAHLDDVPATNAPLLIAPGSHLHGRFAINDAQKVIELCGTEACLAEAGDIWLYATPILLASERAANPASRRVFLVDYAA